ncbi:hypothetical protein PF005_g22150 [Phytophthora fragariae]|uniref:Uncharacterized protein n=1 Tax=Phytophthora fragariae TaxID=53985 RepID=A0A6A3E069_9STRA|nr:hypothetical protein PF009_g22933 [Phytophthora fragariae]KAE9077807.1 hypothetical protein PF007_g24105 [Phytophthora fragariae]KAE9097708.1 hypothetical protein PF006_g23513 [Phytophthora fragariae]KAE9127832.1 hypothetical protein PF010_g4730 [Phytophthora fragariae]KAE9183288.1 hypothetical protein PF005_g22150 [Phytophthora fragariae]
MGVTGDAACAKGKVYLCQKDSRRSGFVRHWDVTFSEPAMVQATPVIATAAQAQVSGHVVHEAHRVLAVAPVM